jgi:DNA-binding IclR family transcriptional regulator
MNEPQKSDLVKSAARVLDVLEMFALAPEPLGVSEVARRLGIPKSSAQSLLATLSARAYLDRDGSGYLLPPALRGAGWVGGQQAQLVRAAQPIMRRIADASGESAFLGVLTPDLMVRYLAKAVSSNEVRYDAALLHLRPAHCTSIGLVILAFKPQGEGEAMLRDLPLRKITPSTVTDRALLRTTLARIRARGYAEVRNANIDGASGVSAPVIGPEAQVLAGLNLGCPSSRFARERSRMIREVVEAAGELSRQFSTGMAARANAA